MLIPASYRSKRTEQLTGRELFVIVILTLNCFFLGGRFIAANFSIVMVSVPLRQIQFGLELDMVSCFQSASLGKGELGASRNLVKS